MKDLGGTSDRYAISFIPPCYRVDSLQQLANGQRASGGPSYKLSNVGNKSFFCPYLFPATLLEFTKVFANEEDGESEQKEKDERDLEDEEEEEEISPEKLKERQKQEEEKKRRRKIVNRFVSWHGKKIMRNYMPPKKA